MNHPVFISYARKASRDAAVRLHQALGGEQGLAFLDTSDSEPGERFPRELADALLSSRVVVVFASKEYFRRWYCIWELEAALGSFLALGPGAEEAEKDAALEPFVLALPSQMKGTASPELLPFPPGLRTRGWPTEEDTPALETLVRKRLASHPKTLGERLNEAGKVGAGLRFRLLEQVARPEPENLARVRVYSQRLPPSLEDAFVGRADDLWRIHYTLSVLQDRRGEGVAGAALTGALHGAGGFGKTRLALEYLHRFGPSHYPGGLFWVNAEVGPDRLEEQFHGILLLLKPEVPELVEFREQKRNAAREMAHALEVVAARERVLYVVDNVSEPEPEAEQEPLATWCPVMGKVSLLATSRARLDLGTEGIHPLPVHELASAASMDLLTDGINRARLSEDAWERIAEWVGHLPLALELLNRSLRAGALEPEELLSRVDRQGPVQELKRQKQVLRRHVPRGSLRDAAEAFSLSYEKLLEVERKAARLIAQLGPEPIPLGLLNALGTDVSSGDVRATLRLRHFVVPVESEAGMFGSMHRVLADYLRSQSPEPLPELGQVCLALAEVMEPAGRGEPGTWPLLEACLPHAESVFRRMMDLGGSSECALVLGLRMGLFLSARGLAERARVIGEEVVAGAEAALGVEHPTTINALNNLAGVLWTQGNHTRARVLLERVLEMRRRVQGEEHPDTLRAINNLASNLVSLGKPSEAQSMLNRLLEQRARDLGEAHPDTLTMMNNLASALGAQGDYAGARALFERVIQVRHSERGDEHLDTLMTMNNLAGMLDIQGDHAGAQAMLERVLEVMRRVQGEAHPDTLMAMNNLAKTFSAQGDHVRARALLEHVLTVGQRVYGEVHPHTLTTMNNVASTFWAQGDNTRARAMFEQVLELRRRVLGEEHPHVLSTLNNLAHVLSSQEEHAKARELFEQVLEVRQRVLGEKHPDTLMTMDNLASTRWVLGDHAGARVLLEKTVEVTRRVLGDMHPDTLTAMGNLAAILHQLGEIAEAEKLKQEVQELRQRS